jgi:predicted RNA-binding protein YlxR (DUF448 family)
MRRCIIVSESELTDVMMELHENPQCKSIRFVPSDETDGRTSWVYLEYAD